MPDHTLYCPSGLARVKACPGSIREILKLPEEQRRGEESAAARQGTRRHAVMEPLIQHPDHLIPGEIDGEPVTVEDRFACLKAWEAVKDHPAVQHPEKIGHLLLVEKNVEIGKWCGLGEGELRGTLDLGLVRPGEMEVVDFKFGRMPVAPDSLQLKAYALGLGSLLVQGNQWMPEYAQTKVVKLTIVQPESAEVVKSATFKLEDLFAWAKEIGDIVRAAKDPGAPLRPGDHCKFCAVAATCPARRQEVFAAFEEIAEPVAAGPAPIASLDNIEEIAELRASQNPEELSADEIGRLLDLEPLISSYFADIKKHAQKLISEGKPVVGWKLIEGRRSRTWKGDENEIAAALKRMQLSVAEIYERKLISPAKAEKVEKISGSRKRREKLAELVEWKEGRPVLAPESDPSPAIRTAADMFEATPEIDIWA